MTIPEIATLALIAVTVLYGMIVLARGRMRAAAIKRTRSDTLHRATDPARARAPDVEHDATG